MSLSPRLGASTARSRETLLAAALLAVGLVTGCSPQAEPAPTATSTPTASATVTPAPTETAGPDADAAPGGILDVMLGESYDDAVARIGATPTEGCPRVATSQGEGYQIELQRPEPPVEPQSPVEVVAVTTPVGNAAQGPVGPRTAAGIGIGSTFDEAQAAYPDAEVVEMPDDRSYLMIETGTDSRALFLAYSPETSVVWGVIATTLDVPPSQPCA
jgi:hypothetical protein